jgi:hypothetical protein
LPLTAKSEVPQRPQVSSIAPRRTATQDFTGWPEWARPRRGSSGGPTCR